MWKGGVRVATTDEKGRILMVCHHHRERDVWILPGGGIEEGETAPEAAAREMKEETGLDVKVGRLLWHIEEVSPERGQRFVNYFIAETAGGSAALGFDPEYGEQDQILRDIRYFTREEMETLPNVFPDFLRKEIWEALEGRPTDPVFRMREK